MTSHLTHAESRRTPRPDDMAALLERLSGYHSVQLRLCESLERLADSLPEKIDRQGALYLSRMLGPLVRRAHDFEEGAFFPALRWACEEGSRLSESLDRLQYEHWGDEAYADELSEVIAAYIAEPGAVDPEKLAYMLRGFFENLRRHIAFEREHLVPLVSETGVWSRQMH